MRLGTRGLEGESMGLIPSISDDFEARYGEVVIVMVLLKSAKKPDETTNLRLSSYIRKSRDLPQGLIERIKTTR